MKHSAYRYCALLCCLGIPLAAGRPGREPSRFRRLVRAYNHVEFVNEDRYARLNVSRLTNPGKRTVDSIQLDTSWRFQKAIGAEFSGHLHRRKRDERIDLDRAHDVWLTGTHRTGGFAKRFYVDPTQNCQNGVCMTPFGAVQDSDTVATVIEISGVHSLALARFLRLDWTNPLFLALHGTADWRGRYIYEQNTEPLIPDTILDHKYYENRYRTHGRITVTPSLGLGRQTNTTHIYHAIALERELMKSGAIQFQLSDETLRAVARLVSRNDSYRLRDHERFKEFKSALDSIIVRDAAVRKDRIRYFSQFQLRNLVLRKHPLFLAGPRVSFDLLQRFGLNYERQERRYPNDFFDLYDDTTIADWWPSYDAALDVRLAWGLPITARWFFDIAGAKRVIKTPLDREFSIDTSDVAARAIQADWTLVSSFWMNPHLLVQAGAEHVLAHIVAPKDWPYHSWLAVDFLIEDNFSVRTQFSLYNDRLADKRYVAPFGERTFHGLGASLSASYSF
ncbi:MAG: hypothetical protein GF418_06800 [Chitinivibrionales bacterium]|nr:hypothetical protein [Chitinivibrionales bacterium]MBD3395318.1 hypothetical protein [Chitinivibrionales bacterium]